MVEQLPLWRAQAQGNAHAVLADGEQAVLESGIETSLLHKQDLRREKHRAFSRRLCRGVKKHA
jgi:hypothetical protein